MRKIHLAAVAVGLAVAAVPMSAPSSAASTAMESHCLTLKNLYGRDGDLHAFRDTFCYFPLGYDEGDDPNWADNSGGFYGSAGNNAMSILNNGIPGKYDVVAVYDYENYWSWGGYRCLGVGAWESDLSKFRFVDPNGNAKGPMARQISSHKWVTSGDCAAKSWIGLP
ncbi:hypothetical protein [Microtetraspora malaysiensis]|uniref:hypothetical protein n=1 Tax=Microtetraspora malaysiensis TaxID=161358 RepID=UPI0008343DD2|nr:hypothetical protein [Microtetraspora malaysiensis]